MSTCISRAVCRVFGFRISFPFTLKRQISKLTSISIIVLVCFRQVRRRYGDASELVLTNDAHRRATRAWFLMSLFCFCSYFGRLWLTGFCLAGCWGSRSWFVRCCCSWFVCLPPFIFLGSGAGCVAVVNIFTTTRCVVFIRVDGFLLSNVLILTVVAFSCRPVLGSRVCAVAGMAPVIRLACFWRCSQIEFVFPVRDRWARFRYDGFNVFVSPQCSTCLFLLHFCAGLPTLLVIGVLVRCSLDVFVDGHIPFSFYCCGCIGNVSFRWPSLLFAGCSIVLLVTEISSWYVWCCIWDDISLGVMSCSFLWLDVMVVFRVWFIFSPTSVSALKYGLLVRFPLWLSFFCQPESLLFHVFCFFWYRRSRRKHLYGKLFCLVYFLSDCCCWIIIRRAHCFFCLACS